MEVGGGGTGAAIFGWAASCGVTICGGGIGAESGGTIICGGGITAATDGTAETTAKRIKHVRKIVQNFKLNLYKSELTSCMQWIGD